MDLVVRNIFSRGDRLLRGPVQDEAREQTHELEIKRTHFLNRS